MSKVRDADRSRAQILDAAEQLFASLGFYGASLSAIGKRANVSTALAVYFFGSKAGLYDEVLQRVFAKRDVDLRTVAIEAEQLLNEHHEEAALRRMIGGYIDFLLDNPTFVPLLTRDALEHTTDHREGKPRHARQFAEQVIEILTRAGVPEAERAPDQLFLSLIAMCYFPLEHDTTLVAGMGQRAWARAFRERRVEHIVRLLLRCAGSP